MTDPVTGPAVQLSGVTLARAGRAVLSDLNAEIAAGEFVGVFGPNGAGKSTLFRALLGLLRPACGELRVLGQPPRRAAGRVGYLPQVRANVSEVRLSGFDYLACALNGERWGLPLLGAAGRREVGRALDLVGGVALARRPLGDLSGGERQRLLLAQSLLGRPELLLLDEPLQGLDPRYAGEMVDLVDRVRRELNLTVLLSAHDLNALLGAMTRVWYLGGGHAELGSVNQVMTSGTLSRLYGAPIEVVKLGERVFVLGAQEGHGVHS